MKLTLNYFFSFTIFLFVFIVISKSSPVLAVNNDYNNGYNNGFNNGYNSNYNNGYNSGYNNNYNNGYNNYFNNYNNGFVNGFNNGYKAPRDTSPDTKADMFILDTGMGVYSCEEGEYECRGTYRYLIWNEGPDKAEGMSLTHQLFVNGVKWPFRSSHEHSLPYTWRDVGAQAAAIHAIYFEKPPIDSTMIYVLTVNSENDPDFSNNVLTEVVEIP